MNRPDYIPAGYKRIKVVGSLTELFNEQFGGPDGVNCVLLCRRLSGDFNALASWLAGTNYMREFTLSESAGYPYFDAARLYAARNNMAPAMAEALDTILQDMDAASKQRMRAELRVVLPEHKTGGVDVWHHDIVGSYNNMMGRFMSCYNAPVTEGARNEDALLLDSGTAFGPTNHYSLRENAAFFCFSPGDLWRQLSTPYLQQVAPPYIHRAPALKPGDMPRLLLVAS